MLQLKTVEPITLELLKNLMQKDYLKSFVLVGGTALALQMGNRKSIDLDLFTLDDFQSSDLLLKLITDFSIKINNQTEKALIAEINNIKVDFIKFNYPFINPIIEIEGIRMASIEDIAAMKLDAISGRGNKKDFYDLFFLLQQFSMEQLFAFYNLKYPHQTIFHIARSLTYFDDAELQPDPIVLNPEISWEKVKSHITSHIKKL